MEAYPENKIPIPLLEPFTMDQVNTVLRTQMTSGRFRMRKRFTKESIMAIAKFRFYEHEFKIFRSWVFWKINSGADWFTMWMKMGGGAVGSGDIKNYTVRFAGPYKVSKVATMFEITVPIESEDPQFMTLAELNAILV